MKPRALCVAISSVKDYNSAEARRTLVDLLCHIQFREIPRSCATR